ncbi:MAG TPA: hypothetical protein VMU09_13180, partial [Acidimicrobiales bacterium]|nr:hypothetical protein [Acidimicrobiales bacterium]
YRAYDEMGARSHSTGAAGAGGNDLEPAALAVQPRLAAWRDALGELTGRRPRLAGSGATWFVEGTPGELGLEGRTHLGLEGDAALGRLLAVRTTPAAGG